MIIDFHNIQISRRYCSMPLTCTIPNLDGVGSSEVSGSLTDPVEIYRFGVFLAAGCLRYAGLRSEKDCLKTS